MNEVPITKAPEATSLDAMRVAAGIAAGAAAVGVLMKWATAMAGIFSVSMSGAETDYGKIALAAVAIGALLLFFKQSWWWQVLAAGTTGGMAIWYGAQVSSGATPGGRVILGSGMYLTVAASAVWLLIALKAVDRRVFERKG